MPWPGSTCELRAEWWDGPLPPPDDFLRTSTGSCYRIEEVRECGPDAQARAVFRCVRLEKNAVGEDDPGVHPWSWSPRR